MPNATITSTASTFGTITGTFAADQSTVTGTISGTITGTLDGSVGVPGPAGPTGATGAAGAGVAAGGTTGQVLQKLSATSYDTGWLTLGTMATATATDYLSKAGNLSGLANATTARTNLSLGSANNVSFRSVNMSTGAANPSETYTYFNTTAVNNAPSLSLFNASYDDNGSGTFFVTYESFTLNKSGISFLNYPTFDGQVPGASTSGGELYYTASTGLLSIRNFDNATSSDSTINISPTAITLADATSDSEMGGFGFGVQLSNDNTQNASLQYNGLSVQSSGGTMSVTPTGIQFPDTTNQTTAAISGDRYLTSSTTSNTISNTTKTFTIGTGLSYTPTQNITISYDASNHMHGEVLTYSTSTGVLTVDINHHTGSGTYAAWVVNVGGVTPATSVAFSDITGAVSGNVNLQAALDLKSNLASPTFSGTPSLPTGSIGVTQTAGNNTTALATTAFVTAAVPAFATVPQTIAGTSTTTSLSPALAPSFLTRAECRSLAYFKQTAVSGSGGVTSSSIDYGAREMFLSTLAVGRAGWMYGITGVNIPNMSRADWRKVDFSKKIWLSGRAMAYSTTAFGASYPGDANTFARITLGGYNTPTTGEMTLLGIGWKKQGGLASFYTLSVHNGTTLTNVATTVSATDNSVIDWVLYSEGNGNVSFYINGTLAATTGAGPTGITASYAGMYREQVEAATTPTARQILETTGGWLYMEA